MANPLLKRASHYLAEFTDDIIERAMKVLGPDATEEQVQAASKTIAREDRLAAQAAQTKQAEAARKLALQKQKALQAAAEAKPSKTATARVETAKRQVKAATEEKKRVSHQSPVTSGFAVLPGQAPPSLAVDGLPRIPASVAGVAPSDFDLGAVPGTLRGADSPLLVSTRRPTPGGYERFGDPDTQMLWQNSEAMQMSPDAFKANMDLLKQEPFMAGVADVKDPYKVWEHGLDQGSKNLEFITNDLMTPEKVEAARDWYPVAQGFSERAARRNDMPDVAGFGNAAVFSPQTPWDINVGRMDRMMDMWGDGFLTDPEAAARWVEMERAKQRNPEKWGAIAKRGPDYARMIAEMDPRDITGKFDRFARVSLADATRNNPSVPRVNLDGTYGDPYGNITWGNGEVVNKAWNILDNPDIETVRQQLLGGGKVPTFYDNIAAPYSRLPLTTVDTHSAGATALFPGGGNDPMVYRSMGLGPPSTLEPGLSTTPRYTSASSPDSSGSKGFYGIVSDAHDLAAKRLGFAHPREVQSATWEGVRDLWGQSKKTDDLKSQIEELWRRNSGDPDAARFGIADLLGKPVRRVYEVPGFGHNGGPSLSD